MSGQDIPGPDTRQFQRVTGIPGDNGRLAVLLFLAAFVTINGLALAGWQAGYAVELGKEHGALEAGQLILMLPTFALFWLGWRHGVGAEKTAAGALAMLVATAFVREIDIKTLGGPAWFSWLAHHGLSDVLLIGMTLPIFWYLFRRSDQWRALLRLSFTRNAIPLYLAGILLVLGAFYFDRRVVTGPHNRIWEELIEINGYLFLLMSAWNHWMIIRRRQAAA